MQVLWPSATRALELLEGSKVDLNATSASPPSLSAPVIQQKKRSLDNFISTSPVRERFESTSSFSLPPLNNNTDNHDGNYEAISQYNSSYHEPSLDASPILPYFPPPPGAYQIQTRLWNDYSSGSFPPQSNFTMEEHSQSLSHSHPHAHTSAAHTSAVMSHLQHRPSMSDHSSASSSTTLNSAPSRHGNGHANGHPHSAQYWHDYTPAATPLPLHDDYHHSDLSGPGSGGGTTAHAHAPSMFMAESYVYGESLTYLTFLALRCDADFSFPPFRQS